MNVQMLRRIVSITVLLGAMSSMVAAAPVSRKDRSSLPIVVKSNELSADNKSKKATFSGNVVARQGDVTIYADKLMVGYGDQQGTVEKIEAEGSVKIVRENQVGTARHASYDSRQGKIVLTGSPKVAQGKDVITGSTITYFIDDEKSVVSGDGTSRVEAVIHPKGSRGDANKP